MAGQQAKKTSKRKHVNPAKARYWNSRKLEKRKVKNILNNNQPAKKGGKPMDKVRAELWWNNQRKGRVVDGYLMKTG